MVHVSALVSYPVKGCAGTALTRTAVLAAGVAHDRTFMVVDADDTFRSQRNDPAMARVRPTVLDGGSRLALSTEGIEDLVIDVRPEAARRQVIVHRTQLTASDQGDEVAEWLSTVLGQPSRLVTVAPEHERVTPGELAGTTAFADAHAILIASEASLDELNSRILERGAEPVPMDRFRPNIVLSGWPEPHTEDRVRRMVIGDTEFGYAMVCVRCTVPMVDQATGGKAGPEPIRTLADYRRDPSGGVTFGMKAVVLRPGSIAVGDEVDVSRWAELSHVS